MQPMDEIKLARPLYFVRDKETRHKLLGGPGYVIKLEDYYPIEDGYKANGVLHTLYGTGNRSRLREFYQACARKYQLIISNHLTNEEFKAKYLTVRAPFLWRLRYNIARLQGKTIPGPDANSLTLYMQPGLYMTGDTMNVQFFIPEYWFDALTTIDNAYNEFEDIARHWDIDCYPGACSEDTAEGRVAISFKGA